jgi:hypothetical protein
MKPPATAAQDKVTTVRRGPKISSAMPTGICITAKPQWKAPPNSASPVGPACSSDAMPLAVIVGIVRNALLNANAMVSSVSWKVLPVIASGRVRAGASARCGPMPYMKTAR